MKQWMAEFPSRPKEIVTPLTIQGNKDVSMDWKYNVKQMQAHFPNGKVKLLGAANHHLANEIEGLRNKMFQQIKIYFDPPVDDW